MEKPKTINLILKLFVVVGEGDGAEEKLVGEPIRHALPVEMLHGPNADQIKELVGVG
jgi:hypothetical protein